VQTVYAENQSPRNLLQRLGFEFDREIKIPADEAPQSMKRDTEGKLVGHKFLFRPHGLKLIAQWFADQTGNSLTVPSLNLT